MSATLALAKGQVALVDSVDAPRVEALGLHWRLDRGGYVRGQKHGGPSLGLHRVVASLMGLAIDGLQVDHISGDKLDNRRSNLRLATPAQNTWNRRNRRSGCSSRFKGVTWHKKCAKWQAAINVGGRTLYLGLFEIEEAAARAYASASRLHHGEFGFSDFRGAP